MYDALSWIIAGPVMYFAILVFIFSTTYKVITITRMPRHLRWDLYPVAHNGPDGSPYQKIEFWNHTHSYSFLHELAEMAQEILLLKRTFLYNRRVWVFTFPMHIGFYFIIGWMVLLVLGAVTEIVTGITISLNSTLFWTKVLSASTILVGACGLLLGIYGCAGLLWLRLTDDDLKDYTAPITIANLLLLLMLFIVGLASFGLVDPAFDVARSYVISLLSFSPQVGLPVIMLLEILLLTGFLIYLPFSRMLHFAAKYFFYHHIMWDDEPVTAGSSLEQTISGYMSYRIEWSADHILSGGSWADQAAADPAHPRQEEGRVHDETTGQA